MSTKLNEMRAEFEAWARIEFAEYYEDDGEGIFALGTTGNYTHMLIANAWGPWQAAWSRRTPTAGIDAAPIAQPAAHGEALTSEWRLYADEFKVEPENIDYDGEHWTAFLAGVKVARAAPVPSPPAGHSDAARDVLAERQRQMDAEGWTPEHDDQDGYGEIARAAAAYALVGSSDGRIVGDELTPSITERLWPWAPKWWRPNGRRRNLVKAGALILAEIERLDRGTQSPQGAENNNEGVK